MWVYCLVCTLARGMHRYMGSVYGTWVGVQCYWINQGVLDGVGDSVGGIWKWAYKSWVCILVSGQTFFFINHIFCLINQTYFLNKSNFCFLDKSNVHFLNIYILFPQNLYFCSFNIYIFIPQVKTFRVYGGGGG